MNEARIGVPIVGAAGAEAKAKAKTTNVMENWPPSADRAYLVQTFNFPSQEVALTFCRSGLRMASQKERPVGLDLDGLSVAVRLPTPGGESDHETRVLARRFQRLAEAAPDKAPGKTPGSIEG